MKEFIYLVLGIILLYGGGEALVNSATRLALLLRVSPLVIGLTLVAFGTSAPELAATLVASFKGIGDVAFGNVVGSNIANLGLVLGLVAIIRPLKTSFRFVTQEVPFMLFTGILLYIFAYDGKLTRLEGLFLLIFLAVFLVFLLKRSGSVAAPSPENEKPEVKKVLLYIAGVAVGVALLSQGAEFLVEGAVGIARKFGISERVIGLTMVAVGTSLPELFSTLVAAYRRAGDIILGNVIGSNIMNVLAILGCTSLIKPFTFSHHEVTFDLSVMMGFFFLAWAMLFIGKDVTRKEGAILLGCYIVYILYLYR
ncbi:calcium/sodium antiporter [Thermodesulfatator atlanticus]|uniref:calcium/sodium antiporter n=1 Tax=Thermodesulfatator atlanticus TaxID=501497 RepID=UPI0003B5442C|nr:calcium/sodium antiporter [Thermodesulfatator atlanticus]